ncbi:uncharacterized protein LOC107466990 [Arachis duranensis]|uniref:Uncharacterized protein LOC107466990 n=1 Tax=Arachis duranensis TaxID=130453 RepID=A0A9C6T5K4_ARADU|nr:uncharacterized protein LOC107466990 [Arachis duranensis]
MAGGNHPKPPPSSSSHRKSRWESNANNVKSPADPQPNNDPKNPKPSPKTKPTFALPPDYHHLPPARPPIDLPSAGGAPFDNRFPSPSSRFDRPRHPDYRNLPPEASGKRKFGDEDGGGGRDELARQREQLLRNANLNNGFSAAGPSELRPNKQIRVDGVVAGGGGLGVKHHQQVGQENLKKAFLHFVRLINENPSQKKSYLEDGKQGRIQCIACGRSAKDFPDTHALIMHTYNSDTADLRVDHLGLHKALCVLMGWNYSKPPDNSKAYQFLSADEAAANQDDLIMWPPLVIIHNTNTGKNKEGRMEGLGNKTMDNIIRELGCVSGKSKSLYGRDGHLGITLVKFTGDQSGLKGATQLAEHFEKEKHGRKDWARVQPVITFGKEDENNPNLVKVDEKKGDKRRVLYGYLGTAFDLDKVDFDTRKKAVIESRREYKQSV